MLQLDGSSGKRSWDTFRDGFGVLRSLFPYGQNVGSCLSPFPSRIRERQHALRHIRHGIWRISNRFVEGKNTRTKALIRQASGYRNRPHLRVRIFVGALV